MAGRSRKKIEAIKNDGEQIALQSFNDDTLKDDELIIRNLGFNKDIKQTKKSKINIKIISIFSFVLILISTIIFSIKFINFNVTEMIWKTNLTRGSENINNKSIKYSSFQNGLMRVSNDGITYIDEKGLVKWTIAYNMSDPIFINNDEYFAVANKNGYEFYVFDKNGISGNNTVVNPIQKISLTDDGILYILQNDDDSSYINVFRNNGKIIDISIKTNLTGDGTAIDISSSKNGEELAVAYVVLDGNIIKTKTTYYNFGEFGQNVNSKRIVGEFISELDDKFVARTHFFDDINSCFIYDGGVYFVSTKNQLNPTVIQKREFDVKIRSISYNSKFLAIVTENNRLIIFDKVGALLADKKIDFDYDRFYIDANYAMFLYGNRVMIYDTRGRMIFDKEMEMDVQYVAKKKNLFFNELLFGLIDGVECIRFY